MTSANWQFIIYDCLTKEIAIKNKNIQPLEINVIYIKDNVKLNNHQFIDNIEHLPYLWNLSRKGFF